MLRLVFYIVLFWAFFIEATLWVFLKPVVVRTMVGLLAMAAVVGGAVASQIHPALPALAGFALGFLYAPTVSLDKLKSARMNWWRRHFDNAPDPLGGIFNRMLEGLQQR